MRKYDEFKIEVEFLSGDFEEINYKSVDTKSYKQMMELYKETKKHYSDTSCKIKFKGISEAGEMGVLFIKEIKTLDQRIKEEAEYIEDVEIKKLLENILKLNNYINKKREITKIRKSETDKRISTIIHNIENKKYKTSEEKIIAVDEIECVSEKRRKTKIDEAFFGTFYNQKKYKLVNEKEITEALNWIIKQEIRDGLKKEYNSYETKYAIKEFPYKNDKERIKIMRNVEGKYNKVYVDQKDMKVKCYNNVLN